MKCRIAEKSILRSLEGRLSPKQDEILEEHLKTCPSCRTNRNTYRVVFESLRLRPSPEPWPGFAERVQARVRRREAENRAGALTRWSLRTVPVAILVLLLFLGITLLFSPKKQEELTPTEALLLRNSNPLTETRDLFEAEKPEQRSMMLIFTSLEKKPPERRPFP